MSIFTTLEQAFLKEGLVDWTDFKRVKGELQATRHFPSGTVVVEELRAFTNESPKFAGYDEKGQLRANGVHPFSHEEVLEILKAMNIIGQLQQ